MIGLEVMALQKLLTKHLVADEIGRTAVSIIYHVAHLQSYLEMSKSVVCSRRALASSLNASRTSVMKSVEKCVESGWLHVKDVARKDPKQQVYMRVLIPDELLFPFLDELSKVFTIFIKHMVDHCPGFTIETGLAQVDYYMRNFTILIEGGQASAVSIKEKLSSVFQKQGGGPFLDHHFNGGWSKNGHSKSPKSGGVVHLCTGGGPKIDHPNMEKIFEERMRELRDTEV